MADMGENILDISGEHSQLQRFQEVADERVIPVSQRDPYYGETSPSVLSFHRLYPVPDAVTALGYSAPGGGDDWQKKHWGVKWGAADAKLEASRNGLTYVFDTAWEAPMGWLKTVSADYSRLTFHLSFRDPISNWVDEYTFKGGRPVEEDDD